MMESVTMFANLPQTIQQEIIIYLETHNFLAAKELYDRYRKRYAPQHSEVEAPVYDEYTEEAV